MENFTELTDIQRFYENSTIFLTGATGFLGKIYLEKILRALPLKKVYILVRTKKDVPVTKRVQDIFESPLFDSLKRSSPDVFQKVFHVEGDCSLPLLGLSERDQKMLIEEVNVIVHAAATTKFDEYIKKAVLLNIRASRDLIGLAEQMKELKTFVYIGTAYSNCTKSEIEESVYPVKYTAEQIITLCEILDQEVLTSATQQLISPWPNTYTFTKQITEEYIQRQAGRIPICITRPTIVVSTLAEPIAAFTDTIFNVAGFVVLTGLGLNKILYQKPIIVDVVPADLVVNACIAAGWQTGISFKPYRSEVPVYHISSIMDNPISLAQLTDYARDYGFQVPSKHMVTYPVFFRTKYKYNYLFWRTILHTMVAHIFDLVLKLRKRKPMAVAAVKKFHNFLDTYEYFLTHEIMFHVEATHKLLKKMSFNDRKLFNFDMTSFNWNDYFSQYCKGLRIYIVKDPMETLPEGRRHLNRLRYIFIAATVISTIILYVSGKFFFFRILPFTFNYMLYALKSIVC